jgi:hypothetical protein
MTQLRKSIMIIESIILSAAIVLAAFVIGTATLQGTRQCSQNPELTQVAKEGVPGRRSGTARGLKEPQAEQLMSVILRQISESNDENSVEKKED